MTPEISHSILEQLGYIISERKEGNPLIRMHLNTGEYINGYWNNIQIVENTGFIRVAISKDNSMYLINMENIGYFQIINSSAESAQ